MHMVCRLAAVMSSDSRVREVAARRLVKESHLRMDRICSKFGLYVLRKVTPAPAHQLKRGGSGGGAVCVCVM